MIEVLPNQLLEKERLTCVQTGGVRSLVLGYFALPQKRANGSVLC
jgi:hypothetical protein